MRKFFGNVIVVIKFVFLLPWFAFSLVINIFKEVILKQTVDANKKITWEPYTVSVVVWLFIIALNIYQNQFIYITYVYACPADDISSKCYKLQAKIVSGECEDTEYSIRGVSGGRCSDSYVDRIYFNNNGYLVFEDCNMLTENKWTCNTNDESNGVWDIQFAETLKIRK